MRSGRAAERKRERQSKEVHEVLGRLRKNRQSCEWPSPLISTLEVKLIDPSLGITAGVVQFQTTNV